MMTTIAADSHSRGSLHHCDVDYTHSAVVSPSTARPDITSMKPEPGHERKMTAQEPDLFDQNTLLPYVYCFIKNFVGASGTNTVAIDNKIEQAMDLVKSHLMFAVREEVEVLKEKIAELMERITHLEHENTILKTNATPETLALIPKPVNPSSNPTTNPT